jgi:sialate O-acetylesterase
MRKLFTLWMMLVAAPLGAVPGRAAELRLHALFGDHMVLQRDQADPVWGTAEPGEELTVSLAGQKKTARAGSDGRWKIVLDPLPAGGPYELVLSGKSTITLKDVLVGEVWVCSGQSNMEMSVKSSNHSAEEQAAAKHPTVRLFTVPRKQADRPENDLVDAKGQASTAWKECTPETIGSFSAVAYFFGRKLKDDLGVPVGLLHTSWGGTPAEVWTSGRVLQSRPEFKDLEENYAKRQDAYEKALVKYKEDAEKAKSENKPAPKAPQKPMKLSCLYNGMIAPLLPYAIRGAIWYQGESNAGNAKLYQTLFPAMIRNWREDWGEGDFPFGFVQLANFKSNKKENLSEPVESNWAELREAQTMTLSAPKTGMAVIIDIGDSVDIHPKNKQDVGKRLALWAEHDVYGKDLIYSGPIFEALKIENGRAIVSFKHVGGGLVAKGEKLSGFSVAGEDRKFVWAEARIDGKTVVVSSEHVSHPVAVRYAWADDPVCNLYNREDLPASPFRTDSWSRK